MSIRILSPLVVSKIAAGEVVERPASVVKELVENSLDAGATQIVIEVSGGGIQLMRVTDNGIGIPESEVEVAFERHATSKITSEADIESISSLGFRGEALPTIASVAEVSITTRSDSDIAGTSITIENGIVVSRAIQGSPRGTTITVRNLFRNVPARLKFLKSVATESGHISHMVTQYSLAYPEVKFNLLMNGRKSLRSPGNGNLRDAMVEVHGLETAQSMLEIDGNENHVTGYISPASVSRSSRNYMSFFINRRWVQSRMLTYAVAEAYQGMLMTGKYPIIVLNITLPPGDIDVNVHPTKREIKFRDERVTFLIVQKAVRETLIGFTPVPTMRMGSSPSSSPIFTSIPLPQTEGLKTGISATIPSTESHQPKLTGELPILRVIGQFMGTYILTEGPDGLYLIDQHAAHERVLFEKVKKEQITRETEVQGLLEPITVDLTAQQSEFIEVIGESLLEVGFNLEQFGERTYLLRTVPAFIRRQDIMPVLLEILDSAGELQRTEWQERIAASLACHGAIKAGQTLSQIEMEELVNQLEKSSSPRTCPHGRPTMIHLSASQLEKEFGR